jgi:hypothetical protein
MANDPLTLALWLQECAAKQGRAPAIALLETLSSLQRADNQIAAMDASLRNLERVTAQLRLDVDVLARLVVEVESRTKPAGSYVHRAETLVWPGNTTTTCSGQGGCSCPADEEE